MSQLRPNFGVALLLLWTLSGCGTKQNIFSGEGPNQRKTVDLIVDHRFATGPEVIIYLVREGSSQRTRLGNVRPSERRTFKYSGFLQATRYQFFAVEVGGSSWTSAPFRINRGTIAEWRTHEGVVRLSSIGPTGFQEAR